uniref:Col_cuticle_N domain-containing protein n=1 Tax=Meloidogyne hapla TaxID=6305 RepID=A0A1I8BT02_MELHA
MSQKHIKQAARGQRQIYEENRQTLIAYSVASITSLTIVGILNFFALNAARGDWMKNIRNEKNQIVDAGLDLNDPQAFGE